MPSDREADPTCAQLVAVESCHSGSGAPRHREGGKQLDECEFEIVRGTAIDFDPGNGTMRGGAAVSPWDDLAVNADYIKREAKAVPSRMGSVLFAISHLNEFGKKDYRLRATSIEPRWRRRA